MLFTRPSQWLKVCLYYNEPWEEILVKAVKPYVDVVLQTGVAERFYFQRSWERGPHIRLCFKGNPDILENILQPNLKEHFLQYFESRPSLLLEPSIPAGLSEKFRWAPNNSIEFLEHDPIQERFGSQLAWEICEKELQASSQLALETLKDKAARWTYNEMMSCAIKMHLGLAHAAGMTLAEAAAFFAFLFKEWKSRSFSADNISSVQQTVSTIRSFQKIYEAQKQDIIPYQTALWELFKNYRKIEEPEFLKWMQESVNVSIELGVAMEIGKLAPLSSSKPVSINQYLQESQLWAYLAEIVFMADNQLGIHNKHEGYLFYVLQQSLPQINTGSISLKRVAV